MYASAPPADWEGAHAPLLEAGLSHQQGTAQQPSQTPPSAQQPVRVTQPVVGTPIPTRLFGDDEGFKYPQHPSLDADVKRGNWSVGICSCLKQCFPTCMCSTFFWGWFSIVPLADRLGLAPERSMLLLGAVCMLIGVVFLGPLAVALPALYLTYAIRREARRRYSIGGNACSDMLCSIFCAPCSLSQVTRHMFPFKKWWDCGAQGYEINAAGNDIEQQNEQQQHNNVQAVTGVYTRSNTAGSSGAHIA